MASRRKGGRKQRRAEMRSQRRQSQATPQSRVTPGTVVVAALVVGVLALVGFGAYTTIVEGGKVSDFEFTLYQGEEVLGEAPLRFSEIVDEGKPVVLNFWAGQCPPCRAEMPDFQAVYEEHKDEIVMLGLDVGTYTGLGNRSSALVLLDQLRISYPAGPPRTSKPVDDYMVRSMPTTVFLSADGSVFRRWEGGIRGSDLREIVSDLVAQP